MCHEPSASTTANCTRISPRVGLTVPSCFFSPTEPERDREKEMRERERQRKREREKEREKETKGDEREGDR